MAKARGIRQRSPGTFQITVYTGRMDANGNYQRIIETLRGTKKQAEQRRAELMADLAAGRYLRPAKETVAGFFERWLDSSNGLGVQSKRLYRGVIRNHIVPYIGNIPISQLDLGHILVLYAKWGETNLAPISRFSHQSILNRGLSAAQKWKLINSNPAEGIDRYKANQRPIVVLDSSQMQSLIGQVDQHRFQIAYRLLIHTGMRVGEVLGLRWKDIDLDLGFMHVAQQYHILKTFSPTKGNKGPRKVDIDTSLVAMLRQHKIKQNKLRLVSSKKWTNNDLVFCTDEGLPYTHQQIQRPFKRMCKKIELPAGFRLHDLRHNHASVMLSQGADVKVVQERLGHATPYFTMSVYGHQMPGRQQEAAQRFADSLIVKTTESGRDAI